MAVFNGFFALGTGVTNFGVFSEATGYVRPAVALIGTAQGGLTQALGQVTGITGPVGGRISEGAIFDAINGGNCLCRWHWTTATSIPNTFAAITLNFVFNTYLKTALNLSLLGGGGSSGSSIDQGAQMGMVNGNPLIASSRLGLQSGSLVATSTVPAASAAYLPQILTVGSAATMTGTLLLVNKSVGSATAVMLPPTAIPFTTYTIKDQKGDAATNNITLTPPSGLIDGAANYVMNVNYMAVSVVPDGVNWSII